MRNDWTVPCLSKSEFLKKIRHSFGLIEVFPSNSHGYKVRKTHDGRALAFSAWSLLEIRDSIVSDDCECRSSGDAALVMIIKAIATQFHSVLLLNHDEIISWSNDQELRFVLTAIERWSDSCLNGSPLELSPCYKEYSHRLRLRESTFVITGALFGALPAHSFEYALLCN